MLIRLTADDVAQLLVAQLTQQRPELQGAQTSVLARIRVEGGQPVLDGIDIEMAPVPALGKPQQAPMTAPSTPPIVPLDTLIERVNADGVVECILTKSAWDGLKAKVPSFQYYVIDNDPKTANYRLVVGRSPEDLEVYLDRG